VVACGFLVGRYDDDGICDDFVRLFRVPRALQHLSSEVSIFVNCAVFFTRAIQLRSVGRVVSPLPTCCDNFPAYVQCCFPTVAQQY